MSLSALKGPGEVETEILFSRIGGYSGAFLVVEGDDDSRFFRGRITRNACEIVIAGGKPAVEGGIQRLDAKQFRGALGVCDDDCASLNGCRLPSTNLIYTESRDLDASLVRSSALERLLAEYGDSHAIKRFEEKHGAVRDNLLRIALPFGQLRWLSARDGIGIGFSNLRPFRFIKPNWSFNPDELFDAAANQVAMDMAKLKALVDTLPTVDPWLVCQGHDLIDILAIGLRRGTLGSRNPGSEQIAAILRASLDNADWLASQLAKNIRQWEANNAPFRVL
ncbi:MAG: DUF4435 domain-containing protein [Polyangiaceae bacterium]|nr:DUF4435 domain-containing protein [Polyangiaceae bacterium]